MARRSSKREGRKPPSVAIDTEAIAAGLAQVPDDWRSIDFEAVAARYGKGAVLFAAGGLKCLRCGAPFSSYRGTSRMLRCPAGHEEQAPADDAEHRLRTLEYARAIKEAEFAGRRAKEKREQVSQANAGRRRATTLRHRELKPKILELEAKEYSDEQISRFLNAERAKKRRQLDAITAGGRQLTEEQEKIATELEKPIGRKLVGKIRREASHK
jgi:hypothetical protein